MNISTIGILLGIIVLLTIIGYVIYLTIITQPLSLLFDGTGYTTFAASGDYNATKTNFSCDLKTVDSDGLILHGKANDDDMFSIKLSGGVIIVEIDTGSGVVTLPSNTQVNNGEWHTINLVRDGQHISLKVDNEIVTSNTGAMTGITRPDIIYIGGSILDISNTVQGFVGYMRNISFANRPVKDMEFDLSVGGVTIETH